VDVVSGRAKWMITNKIFLDNTLVFGYARPTNRSTTERTATMSIFKVHAATIVTVSDHRNLLAAWERYSVLSRMLIGSFQVKKPLTDAQLRRLPMELRDRLTNGEPPCTSVVELERIFGLPDTRTAQ